jgi:hypothetical protein
VITFDDSLWPLLHVKFVGATTNAEFDVYLQTLSSYLQRKEKYITLVDASQTTAAPPVEQRQKQVDWLHQNEAVLREYQVGTAYVITSPLIRLAMNVIYLLKPPASPYTVVSDLNDAYGWSADRFRAVGMLLPSVLIRSHFGFSTGKTGT